MTVLLASIYVTIVVGYVVHATRDKGPDRVTSGGANSTPPPLWEDWSQYRENERWLAETARELETPEETLDRAMTATIFTGGGLIIGPDEISRRVEIHP